MKKRHIFINAFLVIGGILIDRFIRNIHITFRTIMNMLCKIFKSFDSMKQMQIDKVPGKITPNIKKYGKKFIFVKRFFCNWGHSYLSIYQKHSHNVKNYHEHVM